MPCILLHPLLPEQVVWGYLHALNLATIFPLCDRAFGQLNRVKVVFLLVSTFTP